MIVVPLREDSIASFIPWAQSEEQPAATCWRSVLNRFLSTRDGSPDRADDNETGQDRHMRTDRTKALPPFFTQVSGSLPRPKLVRDLIDRRGSMPADEYSQVMNDAVMFAIRLQEQAGLDVISDGEWRRIYYLDEFLHRVGGHAPVRPFEHQGEQKFTTVVTGRMERRDPLFVEDASFLVAHTDRCTKYALPSPFLIAIRKWHEDFSTDAYPTIEHYMEHVTELLAAEAQALAETGIDIIQLDDPALTYLCDRNLNGDGQTHDDRLKREWDIERQAPAAISAVNQIAALFARRKRYE
jgi:5-methyltetrahydropteroyltriglutamate--homocysteine methyltransferase